jgi:4-amino-4-deoxy-L-arabinose transferase-like glycosyltransferase
MARTTPQRSFLVTIAAGYLLVGAAFAIFTPDWQAPDEPAHYNYIAHIATEGRLPVIAAGDWDAEYLEQLKAARFDPARPGLLDDLDRVRYENHQPPLYYLLAAPVYGLTGGSLLVLRLFSVTLGLVIVLSAYGVGRLMIPARPWIALAAAAFVAFLPQHMHILASVNNDALGWALVGLILLATVAYLQETPLLGRTVRPWQLGLLVGIGFVTKATTYFLAGVVLVALLLRWWAASRDDRRAPLSQLLRAAILFLLPALILGALWWGRNLHVYGFPDFLGLAAHDHVVADQPRTADRIEALGLGGYLWEAARVTFRSFWGKFGWMAYTLPGYFYPPILAGLVLALTGWVIDAFQRRRNGTVTPPPQRNAWIVLGLTALLSALAFVYYNTEFQQYQGRYLFPLLIPLALWLALGLDVWRRLARLSPWLLVGLFVLLAPVNMWLLWRVIVPLLSP